MRTPDISTDVLIERRNLWEGHGLAMQRCRHLPSPSLSSPTDLQLQLQMYRGTPVLSGSLTLSTHTTSTSTEVCKRESSLARGSGKNAELAASQRLVRSSPVTLATSCELASRFASESPSLSRRDRRRGSSSPAGIQACMLPLSLYA